MPSLSSLILPGLILILSAIASAAPVASPQQLRELAHAYYDWQNREFPVAASDSGRHAGDSKLTNYSAAAIDNRRHYVRDLLAELRAAPIGAWSKNDQMDALLFRAQLEMPDFEGRVIRSEEVNPLLYVDECSNAIFSLLKKEYASHHDRAVAATARLRSMPALLSQAKANLTQPVRLYAQLAIESARSIDPLFNESLMTLADGPNSPERHDLDAALHSALKSIHGFADYLTDHLPRMPAWHPMGLANYEYLLNHVYMLPINATQLEMLGQAELARYRGLEALLPKPEMANPDPARARSLPRSQQQFLAAYEDQLRSILGFLRTENLITIPTYVGAFHIRQLPEAFKPTSPGGFMNPPGVYDADTSGFYFIPTYSPDSSNFYIRAAIEEPRPILGHEGIPGHFLQISIANHLHDEIRRHHSDNVFIEGWALYTEEMLLRRGFYTPGSAAEGQTLGSPATVPPA